MSVSVSVSVPVFVYVPVPVSVSALASVKSVVSVPNLIPRALRVAFVFMFVFLCYDQHQRQYFKDQFFFYEMQAN